MPQIIQYIDAIARQKKRAVLYIQFGPEGKWNMFSDNRYDHNDDERRTEVLEWLTRNNIRWEKCGPFVTGGGLVLGYMGDVYLDIPYDEQNEQYQLVREYLENLTAPCVMSW